MDIVRRDWGFSAYIENLIHIDEIYEFNHVERVQNYKNQLLEEVWERWPEKCEEHGVVRPA